MSKEKKLASVKTGLPSNLEVGLNIISQIMLVSVCKPGYSCLCSLQEFGFGCGSEGCGSGVSGYTLTIQGDFTSGVVLKLGGS